MKPEAGAAAVALAAQVQDLVREAFPTRPWAQLVACLSPVERESLGGGDNRQLSSRMSGQFGAKSRRGPSAATITVILTHCLPHVPEQDRLQRHAEIDKQYKKIHGQNAELSAPAVPQQRRSSTNVRQLRDDNAMMNARVVELETELKATRARMAALEAELAATALAAPPRTVGILPPPLEAPEQPALVRPYTRDSGENVQPSAGFPPTGPAGPPRAPRRSGPDIPGPGELSEQDDGEPSPGRTAHDYRTANQPRTFPPLPQYRPDLQETAPEVPLLIPPQRAVGRAAVPATGTRTPPGWSAVTAAWDVPVRPLRPLWQYVAFPDWPVSEPAWDERTDSRRRRRVGQQMSRPIAEIRSAWADQWADLAPDQMPAAERGWAQIPALITVMTLAMLMTACLPLLT